MFHCFKFTVMAAVRFIVTAFSDGLFTSNVFHFHFVVFLLFTVQVISSLVMTGEPLVLYLQYQNKYLLWAVSPFSNACQGL